MPMKTISSVPRAPIRPSSRIGLVVVALALAAATPPASGQQPATKPATVPAFKLGFKPQAADAAAKRVGGISRHAAAQPGLYLSLLAPAGVVGTTTKEQPAIYWYLSAPTDQPILVGLKPLGPAGTDTKGENILETTLKGRKEAGLHRLDLAAMKDDDGKPIRLAAGMQYGLAINVLAATREPSGNPSASCRLRRVAVPAGVENADSLPPGDAARRYAEAGVWFDAVAALNAAIDAAKGDAAAADALRQGRRELLRSQGLEEDDAGRIEEAAAR